jgi:hypothetical protein
MLRAVLNAPALAWVARIRPVVDRATPPRHTRAIDPPEPPPPIYSA